MLSALLSRNAASKRLGVNPQIAHDASTGLGIRYCSAASGVGKNCIWAPSWETRFPVCGLRKESDFATGNRAHLMRRMNPVAGFGCCPWRDYLD